jgi:hypothetical protein
MREILERRIRLWLDDPESSVVYAEELDERWAVRMSQEARDATTVWFDVGERSLQFEAYFMPAPLDPTEVHRQALVRNHSTWRVFFAVDREGALLLRGRLAEAQVSLDELDLVLGEIYEMVEVAFRAMIRAGFPSKQPDDPPQSPGGSSRETSG